MGLGGGAAAPDLRRLLFLCRGDLSLTIPPPSVVCITTWPSQGDPFDRFRSLLRSYRKTHGAVGDGKSPRLKIASPKTHKTGSSTLSSILFRAGSRYGKRMYPGDTKWSFLSRKDILKPASVARESFDMEFHHLSANGRWKLPYQSARAFYDHILGPRADTVAVIRDPPQQLVSWAYYYYVPQHRNEVGEG